jgi:hypothetical protein
MIIQLQFSEIMGCANLFQRCLTLAVYCVSTPIILLTRVHVTWLVHKWSFINTCAICYVLKRISSSILHFSSIIFFILFTFYSSIQMNSPFSCYFLDLRISFPGIWDSTWKKNRRYKNVISPVHLIRLVYL